MSEDDREKKVTDSEADSAATEKMARAVGLRRLNARRITVAVTVAVIMSAVAVSYFVVTRDVSSRKLTILITEETKLNSIDAFLEREVGNFVSDLRIASQHAALRQYLKDGSDENLAQLSGEYLTMSQAKGVYDQIRYLDENGQETVRVNYNFGKAQIVAPEDLQNKKGRYYFDDTFFLERGEVFVSPLDLNIENSEIETPRKPVIRVGEPVFDESGNKRGIVLLNYLAGGLLDNLARLFSGGDSRILVANREGYWLKGLSEADEWGFMYEDGADLTVASKFPDLWKVLANGGRTGQVMTKDGLFSYVKFAPLSSAQVSSTGSMLAYAPSEEEVEGEDYRWFVMTYVPAEVFSSYVARVMTVLASSLSVMLLLAVIMALRLYRSVKQRDESEVRALGLLDLLRIINRILRHDVKNRLTQIKWALEESENVKGDELLTEAYGNIGLSLERMEQMKRLEQLAFGKGEYGLFRISEVIKSVAEAEAMEIILEGDAEVRADDAIYSLFENFVRNARAHGGVEKINISVRRDRSRAHVTVSDEGAGMREIDTSRIFQEGHFGGETGNTGLGLYIIRRTIERYGGTVSYRPNEPHGAIFEFDLPLK